MSFILSHYYVTTIALIALCALAMICDNRKLAGEMLWPGFPPPHVQISSLSSVVSVRFGDIAPAACTCEPPSLN